MLCPAEVGAGAHAQTVDVLGFAVAAGSRQQVLDELWLRLERRAPTHVVTLNPEMIERAWRQPSVRRLVAAADVLVADGVGLEWASKVLGAARVTRYPGIDLALDLMTRLAQRGGAVYLLGAAPKVAAEAASRLQAQLPGLIIAGCADGYFTAPEESGRVAAIVAAKPDMLLVGMGFPKQEEFIARYRDEMGATLMIGVGGALEVFAGHKRRAPALVQRAGLEWAYRSLQDVSRLKRLGVLPRFIWLVLRRAGGRSRD